MGSEMMRFEDLIITRTDERPLSIFHSVWSLLNLSMKPNLLMFNLSKLVEWTSANEPEPNLLNGPELNLFQAKSITWEPKLSWSNSFEWAWAWAKELNLLHHAWASTKFVELSLNQSWAKSLRQIQDQRQWNESNLWMSLKTVKWVIEHNEHEAKICYISLSQIRWMSISQICSISLSQRSWMSLSRFSAWVWANSEPGIRDEMRCPMLLSDRWAWVESSSSRDRQTDRQTVRQSSFDFN
jgi:hypothetical protein